MAPVTVEGSPKTLEGPGWDNSEAVKFTAVGLLLPEIRVPSEVGTLAIGAASASAHPLSATSMPLLLAAVRALSAKDDERRLRERREIAFFGRWFSDGENEPN